MIKPYDAIKIIKEKFPNNIISVAYEFNTFYTFSLTNKKKELLMDSCIGIYKKDGKIFVFNPLNFDNSTLKNRRKISNDV